MGKRVRAALIFGHWARTVAYRPTCEKGTNMPHGAVALISAFALIFLLAGCSQPETAEQQNDALQVSDTSVVSSGASQESEGQAAKPTAEELRAKLDLSEDYRSSFNHGTKTVEYQKYIVLHDTEVDASGSSIVDSWEGSGNMVAAHFVVNKDGSIVQCVPLDAIAHHAGYGDTGHNESYGVTDESRDDKAGTTSAPSRAIADYGMNSYSVGIEIVHVGGAGDYPEEQLQAVDSLIAYIDAYYGKESTIIDHKAWRTGNSDTSPEFADYLANYEGHRTHA